MTVWCGVAETFILSPYFFNDVTSSVMQTCSITDASYKAMLENYIILEFQQLNVINTEIVWMQDGAPLLIPTSVPQMLHHHIGDRTISRN